MPSAIYQTTNTLRWLKECRARNANSIRNTATGEWLKVACQIIERQYGEIQQIRNEQLDEARELLHSEAKRLGIEPKRSVDDYDYFD